MVGGWKVPVEEDRGPGGGVGQGRAGLRRLAVCSTLGPGQDSSRPHWCHYSTETLEGLAALQSPRLPLQSRLLQTGSEPSMIAMACGPCSLYARSLLSRRSWVLAAGGAVDLCRQFSFSFSYRFFHLMMCGFDLVNRSPDTFSGLWLE